MPNEIVSVITFQREPLLYLCLEAIRREDPIITILVWSDGPANETLCQVCQTFDVTLTTRNGPAGYGNSANVIRALSVASAFPGVEIVHSIEDDTIIHPGYLEWARAKLNAVEIVRTPNPIHLLDFEYAVALGRLPEAPEATWYESPCVSWRVSALRRCLALIPDGYFANPKREDMQSLLDAAFPDSKYSYGSAEQDGFFLRAMEKLKLKTAFPPKAFASHIGSWGYNRPGGWQPSGTFEEQVAQCRALLTDRQRRYELFGKHVTDREMEGM